jgi:hypothetical protein
MPKRIAGLDAQLLRGAARRPDLVYMAVTDDEFVRAGQEHSFFVSNQKGQWFDCGRADWKCVGMTVVRHPTEKMLALSENGEVHTYVKGVSKPETIEPLLGSLRGVCAIDDRAVAFGIRRQVFVREDEGQWRAMHAPNAVGDEEPAFEAMCGRSLSDLYAVGWDGEIWHYNGKRWRKEDSPTDIILTGATVHSDGKVYICGQDGTLLRGLKGQWEIVADGQTVDDFWWITSFNDRIYVASMGELYVLEDDQLEPVDLGDAACDTFYVLTQAQGVLWSLGSEDIAFFDGATWTKIL